MFGRIGVSFLVPALLLATPAKSNDGALFKFDGKKYSKNDLSPSAQQSLHEIDLQRYRQVKATIEGDMLDRYFSELAKKDKKSKEEVELAELKVNDPSDKELKKFFDDNRDKIPPNYTYEQVKEEIKRILVGQNRAEKRQKLLEQIKKKRGFEFLMSEPESPKIDIKTAGYPTKGKSGAKVQIVEFADYQCPHCKEASEAFGKFMKKYSDKVELVFIDFPINRSGISRIVAEGGYCANKQNKYWEYHEMAFSRQNKLTKDSPMEFAKELKLNTADFEKCAASAEAKAFVSTGKDEGDRVGVSGTPTIFINGRKYSAGHDYDSLKSAVDKLL